jgi:hypothetical protein
MQGSRENPCDELARATAVLIANLASLVRTSFSGRRSIRFDSSITFSVALFRARFNRSMLERSLKGRDTFRVEFACARFYRSIARAKP